MLLVRDDEVRLATSAPGVLDRLETMLSRPHDGSLELPGRITIDAANGAGWLRLMPVIAYDTGYAGYKAMNFHPEHGVRYVVAMISLADGSLVAMLDADWITAYRTAATAAIAVRHLAPTRTQTVGVLGSGTQARALLETAAQVISPERVLVFSPTEQNRVQMAAEMQDTLGLPVTPVGDPRELLGASDVVLSAIRANGQPVIHAEYLRPGALVCGISSVRPEHREVDVSVWSDSLIVVDDLSHVLESGDGLAVAAAGIDVAANARELWQVLRDPTLGRRSDDQRVLFKSVGTAEQDIALAAIVLENAGPLGLGEEIPDFPSLRPIQTRVAAPSR